MLGNRYDSQVCSISRTLEVFGERWTLLIMRNAAFAGSTRFVEFQRSLGIATNVLTARLAHLVEEGALERVVGDDGEQAAYRLTEKGHDLVPALIALTEWGDRWASPSGAPVLYRHGPDDHPVRTALVCDECGPLTDTTEIEALPGPGMPEPQAARLRDRHRARRAA
ncbi:helix-turn-helix domain-containing protein [Amnibacterium sp.]|uniref:winged helix-turn-helix transcriptional regulator n=1 Tax=Amnibacterium sp. TaxID=1872496 RepID=UPI0026142FD7|nr:helix-turn-helix domain-containing protein [Amnibacterium sp.]